jgi:hypothetical protein
MSALPSFIKQQVSERTATTTAQIVRVLNALQSNLSDIFTAMAAQPQSAAVLLENVTLQAGSNQVAHGLGRTPVTAFASLPSVNGAALSIGAATIPGTFLNVVASEPCTASLLVM